MVPWPGSDQTEISRSLRALTLPRAREQLAITPDRGLLEALRRGAGGRLDPPPSQVFSAPIAPQVHAQRRPLWPYALWAALALLVADLAGRRLPGRRTTPARTPR